MLFTKLDDKQLKRLREELSQADTVDWYRRLKIIELSSQHKSVPELSTMFDLCQAVIRDYIHRFTSGGFDGLKRKYSSGCPVLIPLDKPALEELLRQSPSHFELLDTGARNWTQKLLVHYFSKYHQVQITRSAISKYLTRLDIRLNRGKLKVTSPDPEYQVKRIRVEALKKSL